MHLAGGRPRSPGPRGLRAEGAGGEWPAARRRFPEGRRRLRGRGGRAGGRGAMAWARSVATGWLGGFLLLPGELGGGQGPGAGGLPGLGTRRRGVPKSRSRGGGVPRKGPCPEASTGPGTCRHGGWAAHRRRRAAWILAGRTTTLPAPARGGVTGCLDGKLKRGAGDNCGHEPPGVLTEASVSERPGHPAVAVPTLGDMHAQCSPSRSSLPLPAPL